MSQPQRMSRIRSSVDREDTWRRRGRWLERVLIIYGVYLAISYIFLGVDPITASTDPGVMLANLRPFLLQAIVLMSFIVIQFVALFWFLARGTTYVVYPNEYDHTFDDVRGQPAAVRSTKEVLRLFQGFKDFKQMGGYPPHGILFEGPPGTGKTLMAKAIAGSAHSCTRAGAALPACSWGSGT